MGHTVRRCPQSGGEFGSTETGPSGYHGTEYDGADPVPSGAHGAEYGGGNSEATWQPQDSLNGQNEQSQRDQNNNPLNEQELAQRLAEVEFEANAESQVPWSGW